MNEQIIKALKDIRDKCGEDIFNDEKRFKGAICDVLLGSEREVKRIRKRLIETVELGAYNRLKQAAAKNEIQMGCSHLATELHNEGVDEDVAQDIIKSFAALFTPEEISIQSPPPNPNTFTDPRDGKVYRTVKIGDQVWMAENLNFDCPGSKCYDNDPENAEKYGRLYNWEMANEICPPGWHLPSKEEWQTLVDFADSDGIAGEKLKAKNSWNDDNKGKPGCGTDDFGFSALAGGEGAPEGRFYYIGNLCIWWSSSESELLVSRNDGGLRAYTLYIYCYNKFAIEGCSPKFYLLSVRCLQDKT
ncbi:MAG: fibrobacter succinogenes major paralogous domain-containing protein [Candidatus Fibromonas sp.]|jgi:uncharacterized protein (TIGR02145 family)|nr:fibrobacter succinogenes major paralogous domain-containing protein [Candidatus Fibromonas sp.]